jgi:hypothetical protein
VPIDKGTAGARHLGFAWLTQYIEMKELIGSEPDGAEPLTAETEAGTWPIFSMKSA